MTPEPRFQSQVTVNELRPMILDDVLNERERQERNYPGSTCASLSLSPTDKLAILVAEVGEVSEEAKMQRWPATVTARLGHNAPPAEIRARLRKELTQVAAICLAWLEATHIEEGYVDAN